MSTRSENRDEPRRSGDGKRKPVLMRREDEAPPKPRARRPSSRLILKFREGTGIPREPIPAAELLKRGSIGIGEAAEGIEIVPHYDDGLIKKLGEKQQQLRVRRPRVELPELPGQPELPDTPDVPVLPDLGAFRTAVARSPEEGRQLAVALDALDDIEYAYLHPGPVEPPCPDGTAPGIADQGYLEPAPKGIDAHHAWTLNGGAGSDQYLADVEWGWNHDHADLAGVDFEKAGSDHYEAIPHGTKVLGVIAAQDNGYLYKGITPDVHTILTVGQCIPGGDPDTDKAVWEAIDWLWPGDVLLLEAQTNRFGCKNIPLEAEQAVFDAVKHATSAGITVVAAAGNGGVDLDTVTDHAGKRVFDRAVRDSGAILVGSASFSKKEDWIPLKNSCHGKRVDCFAWGADVHTLSTNHDGSEDYGYTGYFGMTSAASAIVAGAALALQGIALARYGGRWDPAVLRWLLSAHELNTGSEDPGSDRIGVMPDLERIIAVFP